MLHIDIIKKTYSIEDNTIYVSIKEHGKTTEYIVKLEQLTNAINNNQVKIIKNKYDKIVDLAGNKIGEWTVLEYIGKKYWKCQCSCGKQKEVYSQSLINKKSLSCGHSTTGFKDITNIRFGQLVAKQYIGNGKWMCDCDCGNKHITSSKLLLSNQSQSCGHNTTKFKDLTGQQFGEWKVLEYIGNGYWKCQCSCNTIANIKGSSLRANKSKSCGHKLRSKLTINNIDYTNESESELEEELYQFIKNTAPHLKIERHNRTILNKQELDIYIPEKKLAIEFNRTYWHSDLHKPRKYHQQKTIDCSKQGIQLIHIFEYEWKNINTQNKIKEYLISILTEQQKIYGRLCDITYIDTKTTKEFLDKYHLQGYTHSSINIGLKHNSELISVMTFGKPRFNHKYEYELIRYCNKPGIKIMGGAEKMFNEFLNKYNHNNISVISYCDITKFSGNVYSKLKFEEDTITRPNYVWVNAQENSILARYQTQKHRLIEQGICNENDTEDIAMKRLNYYKIYNSGNKVYIFNKK